MEKKSILRSKPRRAQCNHVSKDQKTPSSLTLLEKVCETDSGLSWRAEFSTIKNNKKRVNELINMPITKINK